MLDKLGLPIPVIPAGGIFTGGDATAFMEAGAAAIQVATRFTVAEECGLPPKVRQEYFKASEETIEVNLTSPTGYPMRMLTNSPSTGAGIHPNCEAYGYLLDRDGYCAYIEAYEREQAKHPGVKKLHVMDKTCLCSHMRKFQCWTCGAYTYKLKDTTHKKADGSYQVLKTEHIFKDYQFSTGDDIALPDPEPDSA
jgi:nitronate monooxygenase